MTARRRNRPDPRRPAPSGQPPDETPPEGAGVIRRMSAGTAGLGGLLSVFDQIYAPASHRARIELEEQQRVGDPAPAPTDPLDPRPSDPQSRARFRGTIVIRITGRPT